MSESEVGHTYDDIEPEHSLSNETAQGFKCVCGQLFKTEDSFISHMGGGQPSEPSEPTPAEVVLYGIFQEGRKYTFGLHDNDCERCGFGAMAMRIEIEDSLTVSVCASCKHLEVLKNRYGWFPKSPSQHPKVNTP